MRKYSLIYYFDMIRMQENLYAYKYASRAATGLLRTLNRIRKVQQEEKERFQPEKEAYENSDEYKELLKSFAEKDEDDDYKYDKDPKGFSLYNSVLNAQSVYAEHKDFIYKILESESKDRRFYAKAIRAYIHQSDLLRAFKALEKSEKLSQNHEGVDLGEGLYARVCFFKHWFESEENPQKQILKLKVDQLTNKPASVDDLKKEVDTFKSQITQIEQLEFYAKSSKRLDHKSGEVDAVAAQTLEKDEFSATKAIQSKRASQVFAKLGLAQAKFTGACKTKFQFSVYFREQ